MVERKDVVITVLGASAGLSGLVLVFLGLVVGAYGGLAGDVSKRVKAPLRRAGAFVLVPFALGLLCVAVAIWWLLVPQGGFYLYVAMILLFLAQLAGLGLGTAVTLRRLLWD
jgi:hypothetical protein